MCNTHAAVDKVSWLGLVRLDSRAGQHLRYKDIFSAAIEQSSTNTMHSTSKSLQEQQELATRVLADKNIVLRWLGDVYGVNFITGRQPISPQFNQ